MQYFFFALILLTSHASLAQTGSLCDPQRIATLLSEIQSLQPPPPSMPATIKQCKRDNLQEQLLFWMDFSKAIQADSNQDKPGLSPETASAPSQKQDKAAILEQARQGQWRRLKQKIDNGEPEYLSDASTRLSLARSLARSGEFQQAQEYYEDYLKLSPQDDAADAEYLYTFIWAGSYETARIRLERIKAYPLTPYLEQVVERADQALTELESKTEETDSGFTLLKGRFDVLGERVSREDDSSRQSFIFSYNENIRLDLAIHSLDSELDQQKETASHLILGFNQSFSESWSLAADLGYFSLGNDNFLAGIASELKISENFIAGVFLDRRPLILYELVPQAAQNLIRNRAGTEWELWQLITLKARIESDGKYTPFETYEITGRLPAFDQPKKGRRFDILVPLHYQSRPKASAFYRSYPKELAIGLRVRYEQNLVEAYKMILEGDYFLKHQSSFNNRDSFERLLYYRLSAILEYQLRGNVQLLAKVDFHEGEARAYERSDDRQLFVQLGLGFEAE